MSGIAPTLGKAPCFQSLAAILAEHDKANPNPHKLQKKTTRRLHHARAKIKSLRSVENPKHRHEFLVLVRDNYLAKINEAGWPEDIRTHMRNCIVTMFRYELQYLTDETKKFHRAERQQSHQATLDYATRPHHHGPFIVITRT